MSTEANPATAGADAQPSQVIEQREADATAQGRGVDLPQSETPKVEDKKPLSTRDAIAKAFDEAEARSKADAEKAEKVEAEAEVKPEDKAEDKATKPRAEDGKFAKAEKPEAEKDTSAAEKPATGQGGDDARQSEGRKHAEPPARFLPEARTKWPNVPNEVKAETHRVAQEYEGEIAKLKPAAERYEAIRQFDELARTNGRDLKDSLQKVAQIETLLARNPIVGLDMVMREIGPKKPDGSPLSLYELAHVIAKQSPQQFNSLMQQNAGRAQAQTQQPGPEIRAVMQELQAVRAELATSKVRPLLDAFAAERPDYRALEGGIAQILQSGVIEKVYGTGLTPMQKLEQAYRMAGGQGPTSQSDAPAPAAHSQAEPPARPEIDPDGQKSIKGAPSSGQTGESKRKFKSNRAALEAAFDAVR